MRLAIVSHCFQYSRALCYQLSSVLANPPHIDLIDLEFIVFHAMEDAATCSMLDWFCSHNERPNVLIRPWLLNRSDLLRRGIGRHLAAKSNVADWVYYVDCDGVFGPGCLDALPAALANVAGPLAFPRIVHKSKTHELGDAAIQAVESPGLHFINPDDFEPTILRRSIGGQQIFRGDILRERGYLPADSRHLRTARSWRRTFCDTAARGYLADGGRGEPIDLPNLYRIRHSQYGRKHEGCQN